MNYNPSYEDNELAKLLKNWKEKEIYIKKEENNDIDITTMVLDDVLFHERQQTIDGYVAPFVLQLHGQGSVIIDTENNKEPLPYLTFDIPLDEQHHAQISTSEIVVNTDDCKYTITQRH